MHDGKPNNVIPFQRGKVTPSFTPNLRMQGLFKLGQQKLEYLPESALRKLDVNADIQHTLKVLDKFSQQYINTPSLEIHKLLANAYNQIADKFSYPCGKKHCHSQALLHMSVLTNANLLNKPEQTVLEAKINNKALQLRQRGILTPEDISQIKTSANAAIKTAPAPAAAPTLKLKA